MTALILRAKAKTDRPWAYRYTLWQSERHHVVSDYRFYPHSRVNVELELAVRRAIEIGAFMEGVPYKRYLDRKSSAR